MQRTYHVPLARAGWIGLAAIAIVLAHPGTSIAGGTSESNRPAAGGATLLQRGAGYADGGERASVEALQSTLRRLGWLAGPVDGLFGPETEAAVMRLQGAAGIAVDGIVGPQTRRVLRALRADRLRRGAGYAVPGGSQRVRRLQRELERRGLDPGPVDGRFGPQTESALARLQRAVGLPAHGSVDRSTRTLLTQGVTETVGTDRTSGQARETRGPNEVPALPRAIGPAQVSQPDTPALGAVVLGAAMLLLLGGLAGLTLGRTRMVRPGIAVPVPRGLIAEGEAPSVGRFRGGVEFLILARRRFKRTSEAHYLVNAPAAETPFWVAHSEIATFAVPRRERDAEGSERATEPPGQARPVETQGQGVRALGYATLRDSVGDESGDLRDQSGAIDSHCEEHGWRLLEVVHDMDDGNGKAFERPGLRYALDRITRGDAACLVVPGLERLSRSLTDLAKVIDAVRRGGGRLVVMDVGLDTSTSHGELAADTLVRIGAWERRRLGERTRKGLAAARAKGAAAGRPAVDDIPELKERIVTMRVEGMTLQAIADRLNDEGVPTLRGGREWRPSSVQAAAGYRRPRQPHGGGN